MGTPSLQISFYTAFAIYAALGAYMFSLGKKYQVPGVAWWMCGCLSMALTALLSGVSIHVGEWARAYAAHLTMIFAFVSFGVGSRQFVHHEVRLYHYIGCGLLILFSAFAFYWFWKVSPNPQVRLTINSVVLLYLSMRIAQTLFLGRHGHKVVLVSGLLYLAFSFFNGFRCINIILFPAQGEVFMSNPTSKILAALLIPILMAILVSHIFMIRDYGASSNQAVE